jgi:hypothetical protein
MLARSIASHGAKPCSRSASGDSAPRPQSWPCGPAGRAARPRQAREHCRLQAPGLAAARVGPDREVGDHAHGHAGVAGLALQALACQVRLPLQEAVKVHGLGLVLAKSRTAAPRGSRRACGHRRQSLPAPAACCLPQPRIQGFEAGMVEQVLPAAIAKKSEAFALWQGAWRQRPNKARSRRSRQLAACGQSTSSSASSFPGPARSRAVQRWLAAGPTRRAHGPGLCAAR